MERAKDLIEDMIRLELIQLRLDDDFTSRAWRIGYCHGVIAHAQRTGDIDFSTWQDYYRQLTCESGSVSENVHMESA